MDLLTRLEAVQGYLRDRHDLAIEPEEIVEIGDFIATLEGARAVVEAATA